MATILFAWELGGDYGHLSRLLPLARELTRRGHVTVFAVRDLMGAELLLTPHKIQVFQAPLWIGHVTNLPPATGYAELLMRFGFLNAPALTGIARAWRNLVSVIQPDLLVLDHAPTALLATRGLAVPRMHFGDGFCIPPAAQPIPPFRWWNAQNMVRILDSEQHALATANLVLRSLQSPPLHALSDLLHCDDTLLCTFAELDHYPLRPACEYLGPVFSLGQGTPMKWPSAKGPKLFVYLKAGYAGLEKVLAGLHGAKASVLAHVPGVARQMVKQFSAPHLAFSTEPLDIHQMRAECDLALCHGGAGTTAAMLLAGKPLLLFPMQMEQLMTTMRLSALNVALHCPVEATTHMSQHLKHAFGDTRLACAAAEFAARHAGYDQHHTVLQAADRSEALLKGKP